MKNTEVIKFPSQKLASEIVSGENFKIIEGIITKPEPSYKKLSTIDGLINTKSWIDLTEEKFDLLKLWANDELYTKTHDKFQKLNIYDATFKNLVILELNGPVVTKEDGKLKFNIPPQVLLYTKLENTKQTRLLKTNSKDSDTTLVESINNDHRNFQNAGNIRQLSDELDGMLSSIIISGLAKQTNGLTKQPYGRAEAVELVNGLFKYDIEIEYEKNCFNKFVNTKPIGAITLSDK